MKIKETELGANLCRYYANKLSLLIINGHISENDYKKIKAYKRDSIAEIAREYNVSRQYVHKLMLSLGVIKVGKKPDYEKVREVMNERRKQSQLGNGL